MINSLFLVDLQYTNNYLKPPYITSLQIIYKLFVQQFGQLWLSVLFVPFVLFLFSLLRERLHPLVMYIVMVLFFATPELFSHSYTMLFDYSNMIFFFLGFYFLNRYFEKWKQPDFAFTVFAFTIATYIRSETLVLVVLILPLLLFRLYRQRFSWKHLLLKPGIFVLFPILIYFVFMNVYIKYFIPVPFDVGSQINPNLADIGILYQRYYDMVTILLFGPRSYTLFGITIYFFVVVVLIDLIFYRKYALESQSMLYGILLLFFGLGLLGYLLPLVDLLHTTKRGLLKLFPLMLLYYRNSGCLLWLSALITNWETGRLIRKTTILN